MTTFLTLLSLLLHVTALLSMASAALEFKLNGDKPSGVVAFLFYASFALTILAILVFKAAWT